VTAQRAGPNNIGFRVYRRFGLWLRTSGIEMEMSRYEPNERASRHAGNKKAALAGGLMRTH
jgi:hypothetical protein